MASFMEVPQTIRRSQYFSTSTIAYWQFISSNIFMQGHYQGRIQDFLKGGSENFKKGVWSAASKTIGICIVERTL